MNDAPKMKPCPFCGAEMEAFIYKGSVPKYWANEHWFLRDNHDEKCFLHQNEMFGYSHFGKAENGEPTKTLLEFVEKWNRRASRMNEDKILEVHAAIYDEVETYPNCSVQILRNSVTGDVSVGWCVNEEGE